MGEKVKEETIRDTKDRLLSGIADTQERMGMLPNVRAAEDWAMPILAEQVAKHEEAQDRAPPPPTPIEKPALKLEDGDEFIQRPIGKFLVDFQTGQWVADGPVNIRPREAPAPGEQELIANRMRLLARYPEWKKRVLTAWGTKGAATEKADKVMKVLEDSNGIFGDWRFPRPTSETLIFGPKGK